MTRQSTSFMLLMAVSIICGLTFLFIKKGLEHLTPLQVIVIRLLTAGTLFLPISLKHIRSVPIKSLPYFILGAIMGIAVPGFFLAQGQSGINSSLAGIINSTTPLFVAGIGFLVFHEKPTRNLLIGLSIGLIGIAVLHIQSSPGNAIRWHITSSTLFIILAALSHATGVLLISHKFKKMATVHISSMYYLILLPLGLITLPFTNPFDIAYEPGLVQSITYVIFLSILVNGIGHFLYYKLIQREGGSYATSSFYLMPIVALIAGFLDREEIKTTQYAGILLVSSGVYLVVKNRSSHKPKKANP